MTAMKMGNSRRIGILGGTFDPIHLGHLVIAQEVAHALTLDTVLFVPAGRPWQKLRRDISSAEHRVRMTQLAIADNPLFELCRLEVDRPGPTYTVDTLARLRADYPGDELFFIVGADAMGSITTWHRWEDMFCYAHFVAVNRPGYELSEGSIRPHALVDALSLPISSTFCRQRVGLGKPVRYLVPDAVARYIADCGLYLPSA